MSSEVWNTGEKYPIYKSLRRCVILENSLHWNVLQSHSRRRWWPSVHEYTHPYADSDSRNHAAVPGQTFTGPVFQVHIFQFQDPGHNPTSSQLLLERFVAKESELCSTEMEQSNIEETHAKQFGIQTSHMYYSKEVILIEERKWNGISAYRHFKRNTFQAENAKLVMRLVRRFDQDERETDGAVGWNSVGPKLLEAFQKARGRTISDTDWLQRIYEGSNKMRFQYCMNSRISHCTFVPFKDTLVGIW